MDRQISGKNCVKFLIYSLKSLKKLVLDSLFPISCLGCGREDFWLCLDCQKKIKGLPAQVCPVCEKEITLSGTLCGYCRRERKGSLDLMLVTASYEIPAVKRLIYNLKYRFITDSAVPLAELMRKSGLSNDLTLPDALVPVPLHSRRLRWRGFNQSRLLAEKLSETLAPPLLIPVWDALRRKKLRQPQMEIKNYQERLQNVKGIFAVHENCARDLEGKTILLVDDIATTGATLQECARVLKENGVKKVMAIVIARQTIKSS